MSKIDVDQSSQLLWSWQTTLFMFWKAKKHGLLCLSHTKQLNSKFPCLLFFCLLLWAPKKWIILMSTYSFRSSDRPWKAPGTMVLIKLCLRSLGKEKILVQQRQCAQGWWWCILKVWDLVELSIVVADSQMMTPCLALTLQWFACSGLLYKYGVQCNKLQMQM